MQQTDPPGLQMALRVASWGWRVAPGFVTKDGSKVPFCGGDWTKKATTNEEQIRSWWMERPWLWPGVVGGVGSALVIDCDGPAGVDAFRKVVDETGGWTGGGLLYRTPGRGGGLHAMWSWPGWLDRSFRQAKYFVPGGEVQVRGTGHWTLLGGTPRPDLPSDQRGYVFLEEPTNGGRPGEAPEPLIRRLLEISVVALGTNAAGFASELRELTPDEAWSNAPWIDGRKNALAGLCWYAAIRGEDPEPLAQAFNKECCMPPLADSIVNAKVKYARERAGRARAELQEEYRMGIQALRRNQ